MINDPYADLYLANHNARAEEARREALVASAETARVELRAAAREEAGERVRASLSAGTRAARRVVEYRAPSAHHAALVSSIYGSDVDPLSTKHTPPQNIVSRPVYPTSDEARAIRAAQERALTASAAPSASWFVYPARPRRATP